MTYRLLSVLLKGSFALLESMSPTVPRWQPSLEVPWVHIPSRSNFMHSCTCAKDRFNFSETYSKQRSKSFLFYNSEKRVENILVVSPLFWWKMSITCSSEIKNSALEHLRLGCRNMTFLEEFHNIFKIHLSFEWGPTQQEFPLMPHRLRLPYPTLPFPGKRVVYPFWKHSKSVNSPLGTTDAPRIFRVWRILWCLKLEDNLD